jgi:hypothetical protein
MTKICSQPIAGRGLLRVKPGKSRSEQLFSELPPEADLTADIVDVSQVPEPGSTPQQMRGIVTRAGNSARTSTVRADGNVRGRPFRPLFYAIRAQRTYQSDL